jgi:hypothetical protein
MYAKVNVKEIDGDRTLIRYTGIIKKCCGGKLKTKFIPMNLTCHDGSRISVDGDTCWSTSESMGVIDEDHPCS